MSIDFSMIEIFTNEEARYQHQPLADAVIHRFREMKIAGRCTVFKGTDACYENGELSTHNILTLSFNMPVRVEMILPTASVETVLPLLKDMTQEGIIAVRPMNVYCYKTPKRLIPRQIRVKDIMTADPKHVFEDTPLDQAAKLLLSANFTGLPVVDADHRPVGIITQGDLIYKAQLPIRLGLLAQSDPEMMNRTLAALAEKKARDVMSRPVISVQATAFLADAVERMLDRRAKRLPVVDEDGVLVGILSRLDVFMTISKKEPDWSALAQQKIDVQPPRTVRDIMRRDSQTVGTDTPVEEVIRMIDTDDIQRVAVVDPKGHFLGLISDRDLLSAFAEHTAGIWDYLSKLMSFSEKGKRHQDLQNELRKKTAGDIMQTDIIRVLEETGIDEAIRIMTEKQIKRLPVVDDQGRFRGMISRESLLHIGFNSL